MTRELVFQKNSLLASPRSRLRLIEAVLLAPSRPSPTESAAKSRLLNELRAPNVDQVWFILAVLRGKLPRSEEVVTWRRRVKLDGPEPLFALRPALGKSGFSVQVVTASVIVDVHHTAQAGLATGIQRVVVKVVEQWLGKRELLLAGWDKHYDAMVKAGGSFASGSQDTVARGARRTIIIPWQSTYLLPELSVEADRLDRIQALARFSGNKTAVIGFDCVPITVPETTGGGMSGAFARNLAAVAWFGRVAGISDAASNEYLGWKQMIAAAGIEGPEIATVGLAYDPIDESPSNLFRSQLGLSQAPIVLSVGSHEPRKNHLAILHASEILWREGLQFQLVFVGGNSWNSDGFMRRLQELQAAGRPVSSHARLSDAMVASAYREAEVTLFPSLNEGFGLPVVESLSAGTPVITSNFGSMREIGEPGAVFVDPRNDWSISDALRELLSDPAAREAAVTAALGRKRRSWEAYADQLWSFMVKGTPPNRPESTGVK